MSSIQLFPSTNAVVGQEILVVLPSGKTFANVQTVTFNDSVSPFNQYNGYQSTPTPINNINAAAGITSGTFTFDLVSAAFPFITSNPLDVVVLVTGLGYLSAPLTYSFLPTYSVSPSSGTFGTPITVTTNNELAIDKDYIGFEDFVALKAYYFALSNKSYDMTTGLYTYTATVYSGFS
jgi:hypothetical protein